MLQLERAAVTGRTEARSLIPPGARILIEVEGSVGTGRGDRPALDTHPHDGTDDDHLSERPARRPAHRTAHGARPLVVERDLRPDLRRHGPAGRGHRRRHGALADRAPEDRQRKREVQRLRRLLAEPRGAQLVRHDGPVGIPRAAPASRVRDHAPDRAARRPAGRASACSSQAARCPRPRCSPRNARKRSGAPRRLPARRRLAPRQPHQADGVHVERAGLRLHRHRLERFLLGVEA